jgi:hypothetical protein
MEDSKNPSNAFIHRLEQLLWIHGPSLIVSLLIRDHHARPLVSSCVGRGEATSKWGWLLLLRHNLVFDLFIRGSRKHLLLHQLIVPFG